MRSLTVFLYALVLLALGVHSTPNHPDNHQGGQGSSCTESSRLQGVAGGVGSSTSHSSASTTTTGPRTTTSTKVSTTTTSVSKTSTYTTTVTSTRTNTVTVSATAGSGSCGLSSATTGLPVTTSAVVPAYNNLTVALNTTTSTKHLTNVTNSTHPATSAPNATMSKPTISPSISGFQGVAAGLSSQSPASVFALGCLVFMAALLA